METNESLFIALKVDDIEGNRSRVRFHKKEAKPYQIRDACIFLKQLGEKSQKPYSGNLMMRMPATTHAAVATAA